MRFLIGGLLLVPAAVTRPAREGERAAIVRCTLPLWAGYLALTVGLQRTSSTTAAFLSYLLVVIVPVLSAIVLRRLPTVAVAAGIVLSVAGLERLTGGGGRFGVGEALCLVAAVLFAVHVLVLGHAMTATRADPVRLSCFQLLGVGLLAAPFALALDGFAPPAEWWAAALSAAVLGVVALVLQTAGQREVPPSRTALILMIDPVVAAAGGYALGERVGWRGVLGAALILSGIAVAEALDPTVSERNDKGRYG